MIDIKCSKCGQPGKVPEKLQGRSVKCAKCGTLFAVPAALRRSSLRWLVLVPVYLLLLGAAGAGAYFIIAPRLAPKPTPVQGEGIAEAKSTTGRESKVEKKKGASAEVPAGKKVDDEKGRQSAEEEKAEAERRKQEEAKKALEAKLERERKAKERAEEERKAKEEQARLRMERVNPKLSANPEDVDRDPDAFYGKRLYFDRVKFKEGGLDKVKDLKRFTVGVTSFKGRYFSRVPLSGLFFSVPDNKLAATLIEKSIDWESANYLRVFCTIDKCERKKGKVLPEARIFKIEVYNRAGNLVHTWEEAE